MKNLILKNTYNTLAGKIAKELTRIIKILPLFVLLIPTISMAGAGKAVMDGSFIQEWLCASWSDARWQQEFTAMKNAGMHYLIIGPVAEWKTDGTIKTLYPSTLPNTVLYSALKGDDMVDRCLRNAESAGIKVFIGIGINQNWWGFHGADTTWFYNQMAFDNKVCDEVWSLYKNKYPTSFYGWYWAYEIDNVSFSKTEQQTELATGMNIQLDHLTATGEKLPFMWCPFMNSDKGTADEYKAMWINVLSKLHTTPGDIFSPQDLCGKGGFDLNDMAIWFAALRQAVDTKPGLELWPDVETFNFDGTTATIDRIVAQMKIEQPYSENYITFAYCHYDDPYNIDPGFYNTYLDYINNGVVESTPPSAPNNLNVKANTDGTVELNWDASTDNIGICGYYVYRNGAQVAKEEVPILNGAAGIPLATTLKDAGLNPNTDYTYEVKAYDFAGNISAGTSVKVNTGNIAYLSNKISVGCSYTVSSPSDSNYPDTGDRELTNGSFSRLASKGDPAWEGYYNANKAQRNIVIDLGSEKPVQQFMAYFLYDSVSSISLPNEVKVSVSTDNVSFVDAGNLAIPAIAVGTASVSSRCIYTLSNPVNARYIKFVVTPGSAWTFDDEYEVRNSSATKVNSDEAISKCYSLLQNYPNPFNPSTMIRYQIAKEGHVTLKIYNALGREVRTLVNENQASGNHSLNFNASSFPSGVYFYQIRSGIYTATKEMILLK
jgi:hypothetical protein